MKLLFCFLGFFLIIFSFINAQEFFKNPEDTKIFVNSIPKSGNNLLLEYLKLIAKKKYYWAPRSGSIKIEQFDNLSSKFMLSAHAISNQNNLNLVSSKQNFKGFFILRDPRDYLVSRLYEVVKYDKEKNKNKLDEILMDLIVASRGYNRSKLIYPEIEKINGVADYYNLFLGWLNCPNIYTVRFEKIIGPLGGGDPEVQIQEIQNIACHLGITLSKEEALKISEELFGKIITSSNVQIGSWKKYFNTQHKEVFKGVAGNVLIDLGYEKDLNW